MAGLTRRLLKRVQMTDERTFIGGKYLVPYTTRYDGQSKDEDEKPCTFFSFPYFSVETRKGVKFPRLDIDKENPEHPVRSLIQSRYRLESTLGRDKCQSIKTLPVDDVKRCIHPPYASKPELNGKPIIHVPQIWVLSLSGGKFLPRLNAPLLTIDTDIMITSGPISDSELRGPSILKRRTTVREPKSGRGPSLVRIFVERLGKQHCFTYPTDQCDWWFVSNQTHLISAL